MIVQIARLLRERKRVGIDEMLLETRLDRDALDAELDYLIRRGSVRRSAGNPVGCAVPGQPGTAAGKRRLVPRSCGSCRLCRAAGAADGRDAGYYEWVETPSAIRPN